MKVIIDDFIKQYDKNMNINLKIELRRTFSDLPFGDYTAKNVNSIIDRFIKTCKGFEGHCSNLEKVGRDNSLYHEYYRMIKAFMNYVLEDFAYAFSIEDLIRIHIDKEEPETIKKTAEKSTFDTVEFVDFSDDIDGFVIIDDLVDEDSKL